MEKRRICEEDRRALVRWRWAAVVSATVFLLLCWLLLDTLFAITDADDGISVEIPDFRGMSEASIILADWMELETEYRYAEKIQEGTVISQSPAAGTQRKLSADYPTCRIKLVISLGPAP
ncbi:MAG: PASTA domain-containing protein [Clostridia bacterium]|nr:PASTA domain-containing protein [Clostridia bacterium]